MRVLYLKLVNYVNIYNGLGKNVLEIDFSKCRNKLCIIKGENGSGKSSIFNTIHPFMDDSSVFIPDVEVQKFISYGLDDGSILEISYSAYKGVATRSKPSRCYILRRFPDGNVAQLNENGNITSGKEVIFDLLDLNDDYITLSAVSATHKGIGDLTPAERKHYVSSIMGAIGQATLEYQNMYKLFSSKGTVLKSLLKSISVKLEQIGSVELVQNSIIQNQKELDILNARHLQLIHDEESIKAKMDEISTNGVSPVDELKELVFKRKELESNIEEIPKEYIEKYTEEYIIELTEKNAKLSIQYETLDSQIKKLAEKENRLQTIIDANQIKLEALFDKDIYSQYLKQREEFQTKLNIYLDKFKSINFDAYNSITESEFNSILDFVDLFNQVINSCIDLDENVRIKAVDPNYEIKDLTEVRESLHMKRQDLFDKVVAQDASRRVASKFKDIPSDCNHMKDCPFIDDIIKSKLYLISDEEYTSLSNQLEDTKSAIEDLKELEYFNGQVRVCRHGIKTIETAYNTIPNILNRHLSTFYPQVSRYKNWDEMISYSVVNLIQINVDTETYRDYATFITLIQSIEKDIERVDKEIQKIESSNTESIALKTLINQNTLDLQEVQASKAALVANFGEVKNEFIAIKEAYECISTAKLFKERYINDSAELKEIQQKIDSRMDGVKKYGELSKKLNEIQMQNNILETNDIPNLSMAIEKAKHQLVLFDQYRKDYAEYNDKYEKLLQLKKYTGINGIQTIYMEIFMNQIINDANKLLSLLFKGRFTLQPFIINESEFIIPCIDDNGNLRPDISLMSDSQLSEISMIISFILLHKSSRLYNIIKLDEVDDNLDHENRLQFSILIDQIMNILHFDQCVIISHNNELNLANSDLIITKLEDPEQRRLLYNSGANVIADFT